MKIEVDADRCTGHGRCYALAPLVFEPDDDGYCATRVADVAPEHERDARQGAANCPERAITVLEA